MREKEKGVDEEGVVEWEGERIRGWVEVGGGEEVGESVGVGVGVRVKVKVGVRVKVGVAVRVGVGVTVRVAVRVRVWEEGWKHRCRSGHPWGQTWRLGPRPESPSPVAAPSTVPLSPPRWCTTGRLRRRGRPPVGRRIGTCFHCG